jgi:dual specificity tyrosine-phosphorylation-regulated kinase 2/3/4
MGVFNE